MRTTTPQNPPTPPRVDLDGTVNVRDIGGYRNRHDRPVRRGVFYRADNLGQLTQRGREQARALGLDLILDLRSDDEVARFPNVFDPDAVVDAAAPPGERRERDGRDPVYRRFDLIGDNEPIIARGDTIELQRLSERDERGAFKYPADRLVAGYSAILDDRAALVREIMETLASVDGAPMMYHCVAGQDRTGIITALLLAIAEVDEATIAFDYGETAVYNIHRFRREKNAQRWGLPIETEDDYRRQLCPPAAMRGTLRRLQEHYGGVVTYLRSAGLSAEAIERLHRVLVA
jgi:protein tyrosine/serine phosphatase